MSTETMTLWHMLSADWIDKDPEVDVLAGTVTGNKKHYAVCVSGHKNMSSTEIIGALRAATAGLIHATGGDMSVVGCISPEDSKFDTGDQRAN